MVINCELLRRNGQERLHAILTDEKQLQVNYNGSYSIFDSRKACAASIPDTDGFLVLPPTARSTDPEERTAVYMWNTHKEH